MREFTGMPLFIYAAGAAFFSFVSILPFLLLLTAMLLVMFGRALLSFTGINRIPLPGFLSLLLQGRRPVFFVVGTLLLLLLYTFFSGKRENPFRHLPGAVFTMVAWLAFSEGFSIYLDFNTTYGTLYGDMSVMVVMLLWLYFSIYILFVGAGINASLRQSQNTKA